MDSTDGEAPAGTERGTVNCNGKLNGNGSSAQEAESAATKTRSAPRARRLPDLVQSVNFKYVRQGYLRRDGQHRAVSQALLLLLLAALAAALLGLLAAALAQRGPPPPPAVLLQVTQLVRRRLLPLLVRLPLPQHQDQTETATAADQATAGDPQQHAPTMCCKQLASVTLCWGALALAASLYCASRPRRVFLVDFACYRPRGRAHARYLVSHDGFLACSRAAGAFTDESLAFQRRVVARSGLGPGTYLPAAIVAKPPRPSMRGAREEAAEVMFGALDDLFARTRVHPRQVGVLVVNCSLFNPTPSLASMVVNHYRMRGRVRSFNLGGMGCSAGLIAVDLAKDLLQVRCCCWCCLVSAS